MYCVTLLQYIRSSRPIFTQLSQTYQNISVIFSLDHRRSSISFFFFNDTPPPEISPLPLHAALPISEHGPRRERDAALDARLELSHVVRKIVLQEPGHERKRERVVRASSAGQKTAREHVHVFLALVRSEEHTSELQSPCNLVCRLLLE